MELQQMFFDQWYNHQQMLQLNLLKFYVYVGIHLYVRYHVSIWLFQVDWMIRDSNHSLRSLRGCLDRGSYRIYLYIGVYCVNSAHVY